MRLEGEKFDRSNRNKDCCGRKSERHQGEAHMVHMGNAETELQQRHHKNLQSLHQSFNEEKS